MLKKNRRTPENIRKAMQCYLKSEKGRATRKRWLEANSEQMTAYMSQYHRNLRERCKALGTCIRCHNNPVKKGYVQCEACLKRLKARYRSKTQERCEACEQCGSPSWSLFEVNGRWLCRACKL